MPLQKYSKEITNQTDPYHGGQIVTSADHNAAQLKQMYSVTTNNLTIADSGYLRLSMVIPSGVEMHAKNLQVFGVGVPFQFKFYKFPTFTHGVAYTPDNHYVKSSGAPVSVVTCSKTPTGLVSSGDDLVIIFGGGTGVGGSNSGGAWSPAAEWVLHSGNYAMEIQNLSGGVTQVQLAMTWYELQEN